MKTFTKILSFVSVALISFGLAPQAFAQQNTLIQTSLSAAINATQTSFNVASVTGINADSVSVPGSVLYIVDPGQIAGEAANVLSVTGSTVTVQRGGPGKAVAHPSGAMVLVGTAPNWFTTFDPTGSCTLAQTYVTPLVNIVNGNQWLCSSVTNTWIPGWQNMANGGDLGAVSAAVASAAGKITPSGPLFHVTGTAAITGFNLPVGFDGGSITLIADGVFSWTAANNIALASSTVVVGKSYNFVYDTNTGKFYPSSQ